MDLKDFVKTTLVQIVEGVHEARQEVRGGLAAQDGADVSPALNVQQAEGAAVLRGNAGLAPLVQFDVAVTVVESTEAKIKGGARLAIVSLGADGSTGSQSTAVNRIKFIVPIALPRTSERSEKMSPMSYPPGGVR